MRKRKEMRKKKRKEERKEMRGKQKREGKKMCVGKKGNGSDSQCFDSRKSIGLELKLVYSPRDTSRCQKHKEVGFSPTLVPPNLRVVNGRVVQLQPWD